MKTSQTLVYFSDRTWEKLFQSAVNVDCMTVLKDFVITSEKLLSIE